MTIAELAREYGMAHAQKRRWQDEIDDAERTFELRKEEHLKTVAVMEARIRKIDDRMRAIDKQIVKWVQETDQDDD